MRIGITVGLGGRAEATVAGLTERVTRFEARGFASIWMANGAGFDAVTALAVAGRSTDHVELGTAVVPTFPRHPVALAQQALTAQSALGGRFTLGIGVSHPTTIEDGYGIPFTRPARHVREYLAVLRPLLGGEPAAFAGEEYRVDTSLSIAPLPRVPVLLAALGPVLLRIAGEAADGTITSWVGPRALEGHIVPGIGAAASDAGRPAPRVVVGLPVTLTDDPDAARDAIGPRVAHYWDLPSYRAMFDREGVDRPADVALVGDEAALDAGLRRLADAGATDFAAQVMAAGPGSAARTVDFLAARTGA
jgi:F420-dependent oxidoreductase-like protein